MSTAKGISSTEMGRNPANYHVTPKNGKWEVKKEKEDKAVSMHNSDKDAIVEAEKRAKQDGVDVIIHDENGKIRERRSP